MHKEKMTLKICAIVKKKLGIDRKSDEEAIIKCLIVVCKRIIRTGNMDKRKSKR